MELFSAADLVSVAFPGLAVDVKLTAFHQNALALAWKKRKIP